MKQMLFWLFPFYKLGSRGTKHLNNLPKVTWLASVWVRFECRRLVSGLPYSVFVWVKVLCICIYMKNVVGAECFSQCLIHGTHVTTVIIIFWKWGDPVWSPQAWVNRTLKEWVLQANCNVRLSSPLHHPLCFFSIGGLTAAKPGTVLGFSHAVPHSVCTLFLWGGCFLSPFYRGNLRKVSDWFERPLLLRGRVGIWAPEPAFWMATHSGEIGFRGAPESRPEGRQCSPKCVWGRGRGLPWCWWSRSRTVFVSNECNVVAGLFLIPTNFPFPGCPVTHCPAGHEVAM